MLANVTCPNCQHKYWLQEGEMGSRQVCPHCQAQFFAGASVAQARAPAAASAASASSAASAASQGGYAKTMIGDVAPPIKYNCPRCKGALEAAASEAGTKKNCPNCTQRHQVPAAPKPEPASAAPNLNKTMLAGDESAAAKPPIKYNCPSCKKPLEAPAEQGGTKTNCPACQQRLQIPAAPPLAPNRNKTMLASDGSTAAANAALQGAYSTDGARGAGLAAAGPGTPPSPWAALLTPRNVVIGIVVLLLLLLVVPAVIHGGKDVDKEALAKRELELEKLRMELQAKTAEMDRQEKAARETHRQIEEMMNKRRAEDDRRRDDDRRKLLQEQDDDRRAALKRQQDLDQKQREKDREEMDRKSKQMLEDTQRKLDETKRALETSKKQETTIIQQPAPVIQYPPYSPYYYRPHWWW